MHKLARIPGKRRPKRYPRPGAESGERGFAVRWSHAREYRPFGGRAFRNRVKRLCDLGAGSLRGNAYDFLRTEPWETGGPLRFAGPCVQSVGGESRTFRDAMAHAVWISGKRGRFFGGEIGIESRDSGMSRHGRTDWVHGIYWVRGQPNRPNAGRAGSAAGGPCATGGAAGTPSPRCVWSSWA